MPWKLREQVFVPLTLTSMPMRIAPACCNALRGTATRYVAVGVPNTAGMLTRSPSPLPGVVLYASATVMPVVSVMGVPLSVSSTVMVRPLMSPALRRMSAM